MRYTLSFICVVFLLLQEVVAHKATLCANDLLARNAICNRSLSSKERASALVQALTLQEKLNNVGKTALGVPCIGLPPYKWWNEGLHGLGISEGVNFSTSGEFAYATSFPQRECLGLNWTPGWLLMKGLAITMGAAFDDALIYAVASVISIEARAFNNFNRAGLDLWTLNINLFKDLRWGRGQETLGEDSFHVLSYAYHYVTGLQGGIDPKQRKVTATCKHFVAYDIENWQGNVRYGFDAMVSTYLIQTVVREHWGWNHDDQWIVSDQDAIQNIFMPHNYATTRERSVADVLNAGVDLNDGIYYTDYLRLAISQNLTTEATLDQALIRLYSSLVKVGYFDSDATQSYSSLSWSDVNTAAAQQLAYQAAVEGTVLLTNDGTLPLHVTPTTSIALVGLWGIAPTDLQGTYAGNAPFLRSPLSALQSRNITVNYAYGNAGERDPSTDDWSNAVAAANKSDYVIFMGGISSLDENEGQDGGTAIMDIVLGKVSPAGRLPVTQYPSSYVNEVDMTNMALRPGPKSPGRTYKWYNGTAVFPFGSGIHYTTFTASIIQPTGTHSYNIQNILSKCDKRTNRLDQCLFKNISAAITNTGTTTSDFVTLLFISGKFGPTPYPLKSLVAYERIHNIPGSGAHTVILKLTLGSLSRIDENGNTILYPGSYSLLVDQPTQATFNFTLTGKEAIIDAWPVKSKIK
ncbi:hypothetical protein B7463_g7453, partial [Scytalidium lignicola]